MQIIKDLPADFRKSIYDTTFERINELPSLVANIESMANALITIDTKGHGRWADKSAPLSEGPRELLFIMAGQLDEGIKIGCTGNKSREMTPVCFS